MADTATDRRLSGAGVIRRTALVAVLIAGSALGAIAATSGASRPGAAYLTIAQAGNRPLDADFARLQGPDRANLAAARNDLRDIAAAEHRFDQSLAVLTLPPGPEGTARILIRVNEDRAALTRQAADSATLAQLTGFRHRLGAADIPVEQSVRTIRAELGLPAPDLN